MRFSFAALALLPAAVGAISITGPSPTAFWVQNTSNTISWTFSPGDPNPIDIVIVNANNATLNGAFSIANSVNVSQATFTVTNVTLNPGDNYAVEFVSPTNHSQVFATSQNFTVMPPGTAAATTSSAASGATGTSSGSSATSTSPTSSGSAPSPSGSSAALRSFGSEGVLGLVVACGIASLSALLL
ncbi:hypothetical protein A0H81_05549 [Grifola frondosa]|uniref:Yeast cell wall synthesis Kre9/Knh1-like N-terminal domain-containing protein n=1 Tax=Grifola frondosa TaxID=5627 RepID=A0A1C7MCR5_GRIFR|nr:hypothetical protein A0H81_05549 [Grifola frondosa]